MSTINSTFFLKKPKGGSETLILFSCYFKHEEKKFVYSTGENIHPKNWDFKNRQPKMHGRDKAPYGSSIRTQINRYSDKFGELQARSKIYGEEFTSQVLRAEFDKEFKKGKSGANIFFKAYDDFVESNTKRQIWSHNTIKKYKNFKGILEDYQNDTGGKLTFKGINKGFHTKFTDYCINGKEHSTNTYRRNIGLLKTFMYFAVDHGYTYHDDFKKFEKMKEAFTEKVALKEEDLRNIMAFDLKNSRLERARDVFVFACSTGMRFGELKFIGRRTVVDGSIKLKEEKGADKKPREIPLNTLSEMILRKYDYQLPLIANQKQNEYIKEVFRAAGYDYESERVTVRGKQVVREKMAFCDRISTHTARRTFITMMKRKGKSDKLISKITGHTDLKTLNTYYQVDEEAKREAVSDVFGDIVQPLRKVQ